MKRCVLPVFLLLYFGTFAQQDPTWGFITKAQADSLGRMIDSEKNDTVKMAGYRSLGFYYETTNTDSSYYFHEKQLNIARKLGLKLWEADALTQESYVLETDGNTTKSMGLVMEAERIARDKKNESTAWHPWTFSNARGFAEARIAILAINQHALGNLYKTFKENTKAHAAYAEAIRLGQSIENGKLISLGNLMVAQLYDGKDSALPYLRESQEYAAKANYKKYDGAILLEMAKVFFTMGQLDSAKYFAYASVTANLEQNNLYYLGWSYYGLSILHSLKNQPDSSLYYARKIEAIPDIQQLAEMRLKIYERLGAAYEMKLNRDSASKYFNLRSELRDSMQEDRITKLSEYQQLAYNEQLRLRKINDDKTAAQNKLRMLVLIGGVATLLIIAIILYRNNRQKHKTNVVLESTIAELKSTQTQLIQSEKMASLGELTAGIAHEIQNPLNFVNNFSEVSNELIDEMNMELDKGDIGEAKIIAIDIKQNLEKINHHGKRADGIVRGMLQHSQTSNGTKEPTDINSLADEYLRLSYHGLRNKDKAFNATINTAFDPVIGTVPIIPQDFGRVLLNLYNNAFYAVKQRIIASAAKQETYTPEVSVSTRKLGSRIEITVKDNGTGIPAGVVDKIFQPFFTTKPTGQGTGLGLSLSYDIITKGHAGELKVETREGNGSTFVIIIPA